MADSGRQIPHLNITHVVTGKNPEELIPDLQRVLRDIQNYVNALNARSIEHEDTLAAHDTRLTNGGL